MTHIPNIIHPTANPLLPRLPATCIVCRKPAALRCLYCPRCRKFGRLAADDQSLLAIREALISSFDHGRGRFICHYSGVGLDEKNPKSPYYITFDHILPGQKRLVACGYLFNFMKGPMTGEQFTAVTPALADLFETGKPFDKNLIQFTRQSFLSAPMIRRRAAPWETPSWRVTDCVVCHGPLFPRSMYCARCRRFITVQRENAARREALIKAWNAQKNGFICHYTKIKLEELDVNDRLAAPPALSRWHACRTLSGRAARRSHTS
jgi:hypothetical protein